MRLRLSHETFFGGACSREELCRFHHGNGSSHGMRKRSQQASSRKKKEESAGSFLSASWSGSWITSLFFRFLRAAYSGNFLQSNHSSRPSGKTRELRGTIACLDHTRIRDFCDAFVVLVPCDGAQGQILVLIFYLERAGVEVNRHRFRGHIKSHVDV
jgi:hypothetical protein